MMPTVVVGTKADAVTNDVRRRTREEISAVVEEYLASYVETSAKEYINVEQAMEVLVHAFLANTYLRRPMAFTRKSHNMECLLRYHVPPMECSETRHAWQRW